MRIRGGALVEVPVYEEHARGRNWMAKIQPNAHAPGGWDRVFAKKARGKDLYYIVSDIFPGEVLEFAADYYTGFDAKRPLRRYFFVVSRDDDELTGVLFEEAHDAWDFRDAHVPKIKVPA
jgi:hypothetical protein